MPIAPRPVAVLLAALSLGFGAVACGDERTVNPEEPAAEETTASEQPATTEAAPEPEGKAPVVSNDLAKKPTIPKPAGSPPSKLIIKDIVVGKGAALKEGQTATAHYVGTSWSTGAEFDSSWDRGEPASFPIAQGSVIQGWVDGLKGMKIGGRRELVIPPDLGYGPQGNPPVIAPNETLVFVVDLKKLS